MKDEDLKAAIDDIASRTKGPIELAFETYEKTLEVKIRETERYGLHRSAENKAIMATAATAHEEARAALSVALFEAWKRMKWLREGFIDDLNDIKNTAMSLYPRSKL